MPINRVKNLHQNVSIFVLNLDPRVSSIPSYHPANIVLHSSQVTPRPETAPTDILRLRVHRLSPCSSSAVASASRPRCPRLRWAAPPPPPSSPPRASPTRAAVGPASCCGHGVPRFDRTTSWGRTLRERAATLAPCKKAVLKAGIQID